MQSADIRVTASILSVITLKPCRRQCLNRKIVWEAAPAAFDLGQALANRAGAGPCEPAPLPRRAIIDACLVKRHFAMNKPVDLKVEYGRRERAYDVLSRSDKYFTKSRQIVQKFGDNTVTYGVFLRRGTVCAVNPALEILREYYPCLLYT